MPASEDGSACTDVLEIGTTAVSGRAVVELEEKEVERLRRRDLEQRRPLTVTKSSGGSAMSCLHEKRHREITRKETGRTTVGGSILRW